jgi:hypothetical protein
MVPGGTGWTGAVTKGEDSFELTIGGANQPDATLLAHAHDILINWESFKKMVRNHIASETHDYPDDVKAEVAGLRIDNISLCWPHRPDDGMIFFRGHEGDIGLWRCDYIARKPTGLGCDT